MTIEDFLYLRIIPPNFLLTLRVIFLVVSLLLLAGIIFFLKKSSWLQIMYRFDVQDFLGAKTSLDRKYDRIWSKIKKRLERNSESEWKVAIIEADGFLNKTLEKIGYQGESLGERLQKLDTVTLPSIQEAWQAHRFRNNIVHDPDFKVSREEAENTIRFYEKALQDLNVLS